MKRSAVVVVAVAVVGAPHAAAAGPGTPPPPDVVADPDRPWLIPPVDGSIGRRFQAPAVDWGPGHRGVDYLVPGAAPVAVRAAAAGRVAFAGSVAGVNAVTLEHAGDMETTYTNLLDVDVEEGQYVVQGTWIGRTRVAHEGIAGLHFAVKVDGVYVDPLAHLGPVDGAGAIYLAPLVPPWTRAHRWWGAGSHLDEGCERAPAALPERAPPPNDNLVVVVGGLTSKTMGGLESRVFSVPSALGYAADDTYLFSYRGSAGDDLHEPYERADTFGHPREAAGRLATLLIRIGRRHPGRDVDVIAYSHGGVVARTALEMSMRSWQPGMPRIDHLVTFATPHGGTKLAELPDELAAESVSGSWLVDAVSRAAHGGVPLPDPLSEAVDQLKPDSELMTALARQDVVFGTRILSLAAPHDVVAPVPRTRYDHGLNRVVAPTGVWGHGAIAESQEAHSLAYDFLRDASPACETNWGHLGGILGHGIDLVHDHAAAVYGELEGEALFRAGRWLGRRASRLPSGRA
jgi:Peptidase family M23